MPALPPAPFCLAYQWHFRLGSDLSVSTKMHIRYAGTAPANADLVINVTQLFNSWTTNLAPHTMPNTVLESVTATDLSSPSGGFSEHLGSSAGTSTGIANPASACVVANFPIQRRYRGGKPRQFWPMGRADDLATPQAWTTTAVGQYQAALNQLYTSTTAYVWAGATIQGIVAISYYESFTVVIDPVTGRSRNVPKLRPNGPLIDPVTLPVVSPQIGTQRRRIYS